MKDSIYFSHDADARNDEKIIGLIMEHGYEGYGLFWAIVEMLRTATDYKMHLDCKRIAFALHTDAAKIESIISEFELFEHDDLFFWSKSLLKRMEKKNSVSSARRKAAQKRWDNANAEQMQCKSNANEMQMQCNKGKERKVKERKENTPNPQKGADDRFNAFWDAYDKKIGRSYAEKCFRKAVRAGLPDSDTLATIISKQKEQRAKMKASGAFVPEWPNASTWLNQGRWMDEYSDPDENFFGDTKTDNLIDEADKSWSRILEIVYGRMTADQICLTDIEKQTLRKTKRLSVLKSEPERNLKFSEKLYKDAYLTAMRSGGGDE